jgi:hypothetical protein
MKLEKKLEYNSCILKPKKGIHNVFQMIAIGFNCFQICQLFHLLVMLEALERLIPMYMGV